MSNRTFTFTFEGPEAELDAQAILGDIARLRADKGDVDAALAMHQEALSVYEALGDRRSRAVTLGYPVRP